jgi:D-serine dehydratase
VGEQGWNLLDGDLPLPLAVLDEAALAHNLAWMQAYAARKGVWLAPHGKTTLSPQLCARQLAAGAWGLTFASVWQARLGVACGAQRLIIANQVLQPHDLDALVALHRQCPQVRVWFLVDSLAQVACIEAWARQRGDLAPRDALPVLLEMGASGQRCGCRTLQEGLALAHAIVQRHGGHIQAQAAVGQGCTMVVDWPAEIAPFSGAARAYPVSLRGQKHT